MRTESYKLESRRERLLTEATARGESVIHEDFGTGVNGANVLTFDVLPDDVAGRKQHEAIKRLHSFTPTTAFESDVLTVLGID